uniref:Uncharacterized protein n=1 Tax=Lactuca sativa TaxID=4236 RepID=A0A9R1X4F1_LACSA|nr:hypothetical protein LSAT_V11C600333630 [Lactuca sativa]
MISAIQPQPQKLMHSPPDNPIDQEKVVVVDIKPPVEAGHETLIFAIAFLLKCISYIVSLLKTAFAEIKSQGSEFPFKTHPRSMNIAITSLLFYGLASAAQHIISACKRFGPASVYAIVAHSGRIGSFLKALSSNMDMKIDTTTSSKVPFGS